MCLAICYTLETQVFITHFTDTCAKLPLVNQSQRDHFLPWGRRLDEPGLLPLGGSLLLDKKERGLFDKFFPKPVLIQAQKFLEINIENKPYWFEITPGQYLQGLLLREGQEQRVYVISFTPQKASSPFLRWPLIVVNHQAQTTR